MGVIVSKNKNQIVVDDGTGQIIVRIFNGQNNGSISIGRTVLVIGRTNKINNEVYVSSEIVKNIENTLWLKVRKEELKEKKENIPIEGGKIDNSDKKLEEKKSNHQEYIISLIKKLDQDKGALIEEIVTKSSIKKCEELINLLVKNGEIFEVEPGRVKVLE